VALIHLKTFPSAIQTQAELQLYKAGAQALISMESLHNIFMLKVMKCANGSQKNQTFINSWGHNNLSHENKHLDNHSYKATTEVMWKYHLNTAHQYNLFSNDSM
jgi:hypothetical protein